MKLTAFQRDALQHMADDDGRIIYLPGGWWTTRKYAATSKGRNLGPSWYVAKGTVRALESRGLVVTTNEGPYYAQTRIITEAGRAAVKGDLPKDERKTMAYDVLEDIWSNASQRPENAYGAVDDDAGITADYQGGKSQTVRISFPNGLEHQVHLSRPLSTQKRAQTTVDRILLLAGNRLCRGERPLSDGSWLPPQGPKPGKRQRAGRTAVRGEGGDVAALAADVNKLLKE